jgi:integrase
MGKIGRKRGSRNVGYFFRKGRGWVTKTGTTCILLTDQNGQPLRDRNSPPEKVRDAYKRVANRPAPPVETVTVLEVCNAYLATVKNKETFNQRTDTLYDLCFGVPSRFKHNGKMPKASDRIHSGYGNRAVSELRPLDIDQWLLAHPSWKGGLRSKIQAIKRALNYGVESGLISRNPIRGYRTPKSVARVTEITPAQEKSLYSQANSALTTAIKVCIRTGARPGCEFAALRRRHVKMVTPDRMEWVFSQEESKTKRLRIIRVADREIIDLVRNSKTDPIFTTLQGKPWTRVNLTRRFNELIKKLQGQGVQFDEHVCMYSCRHTYAKRTLQGYWSGKAITIETLARLMGNSPQVCRDHYLQWCEAYEEPLWTASESVDKQVG